MKRRPITILAALALAACTSSSQRAADAMAKGQNYMNAGNYRAAAQQFDLAVRLRDDLPQLWTMRARNQVQMGDYGGAFASYRNALDQDRSNREALDAVSQLSLAINDLNSADKYADQILALDPSDLNAQLVHGVAAFRRNQIDQADAIAARVIAQQPGNEAALVLQSRVAQRRGDLARARSLIEPVFVAGGGGGELRQQLMSIYQGQYDADGMTRVAEREAAAQPKAGKPQLALARQYLLTGRGGDGAETLNAIHRASPSDGLRDDTLAMLTDAMIPLPLLMKALGTLSSVDLSLRIPVARYAIQQGDPALAIRILAPSTADETVGQFGTIRHGPYALAQAMLGQMPAAEARSAATLKLDGDQPEALLAKAAVEVARRDLDGAVRDLRIILRDNPSSAPAITQLAAIYRQREEPFMARKTIVDGFNADRNDPAAMQVYVAELMRENRGSEALQLLQNYNLRNPGSIAGWTARRQTCAQVGNSACANRADAVLARLRGSKAPLPALSEQEARAERDYREISGS